MGNDPLAHRTIADLSVQSGCFDGGRDRLGNGYPSAWVGIRIPTQAVAQQGNGGSNPLDSNMWTKAEDVPKSIADEILERWDKTPSDIQRLIVLQRFLDVDALIATLRCAWPWLLWAKDRGALCGPAIEEVRGKLSYNRGEKTTYTQMTLRNMPKK